MMLIADCLPKPKQLLAAEISCRTMMTILGQASEAVASFDLGPDERSRQFANLDRATHKYFAGLNKSNLNTQESCKSLLIVDIVQALRRVSHHGRLAQISSNREPMNASFRSLVRAVDQLTRLNFIEELEKNP